jgi:hypothetical protein
MDASFKLIAGIVSWLGLWGVAGSGWVSETSKYLFLLNLALKNTPFWGLTDNFYRPKLWFLCLNS